MDKDAWRVLYIALTKINERKDLLLCTALQNLRLKVQLVIFFFNLPKWFVVFNSEVVVKSIKSWFQMCFTE